MGKWEVRGMMGRCEDHTHTQGVWFLTSSLSPSAAVHSVPGAPALSSRSPHAPVCVYVCVCVCVWCVCAQCKHYIYGTVSAKTSYVL